MRLGNRDVDRGFQLVEGGALLRMIGFTAASLVAVALLALGVARALRLSRPLAAALVLVVLLPNAGNYGLSVSLFAFGDPGLSSHSEGSFSGLSRGPQPP